VLSACLIAEEALAVLLPGVQLGAPTFISYARGRGRMEVPEESILDRRLVNAIL